MGGLAEPTTSLTNGLLAGALAAFAWRLARAEGRAARSWGAAFAAGAIAAGAGAVRHGLHPGSRDGLWLTTALAIGIGSFLLLAGAAAAASAGPLRRWILAVGAVKLALYAGWLLAHRDYLWTALDAAAGAAAVLLLLHRAAKWGRFTGFPRVLQGLGLALGSAALRQTELDLHPDFNHNDLFHLLAVGALWLVHLGGLQLQDEVEGRNHPSRPAA